MDNNQKFNAAMGVGIYAFNTDEDLENELSSMFDMTLKNFAIELVKISDEFPEKMTVNDLFEMAININDIKDEDEIEKYLKKFEEDKEP